MSYMLYIPNFSFILTSKSKLTKSLNNLVSFSPNSVFIQDLVAKTMIGRELNGMLSITLNLPLILLLATLLLHPFRFTVIYTILPWVN